MQEPIHATIGKWNAVWDRGVLQVVHSRAGIPIFTQRQVERPVDSEDLAHIAGRIILAYQRSKT